MIILWALLHAGIGGKNKALVGGPAPLNQVSTDGWLVNGREFILSRYLRDCDDLPYRLIAGTSPRLPVLYTDPALRIQPLNNRHRSPCIFSTVLVEVGAVSQDYLVAFTN